MKNTFIVLLSALAAALLLGSCLRIDSSSASDEPAPQPIFQTLNGR